MFYCRTTNNKVNKLHERVLRPVCDDYVSTFEELLEKDSLFTAHHYNIQVLCVELCKVFSGQSETIFSDLFERKILIIICTHSLILLYRKLKLFKKGQIQFDTLDLLYGV